MNDFLLNLKIGKEMNKLCKLLESGNWDCFSCKIKGKGVYFSWRRMTKKKKKVNKNE